MSVEVVGMVSLARSDAMDESLRFVTHKMLFMIEYIFTNNQTHQNNSSIKWEQLN